MWGSCRNLGIPFVAALLVLPGCGKKKDGNSGDKSVTISYGLSDSGSSTVSAGECISFTINGENTTFKEGDVAVDINYNNGELAVVVPNTHVHVLGTDEVRVGLPGQGGAVEPCWCFGPGVHPACEPVPLGPVDVSVRDGADILDIDDAFTLEDIKTSDVDLDVPVDASLGRIGDNDYYTVTIPNAPVAILGVPNGSETFLPAIFGYGPDFDVLLAIGARAALRDFTITGTPFEYHPALAGFLLQGGPGYGYELRVRQYLSPIDYTAVDVSEVDRWDDGTLMNENPNLLEVSAGLFVGAVGNSLTGGPAVNNYNPNPNSSPDDEATWGTGCVSQDDQLIDPAAPKHFPILGRGRDVVYKYVAPADGDVLVAVQSEGTGSASTGDFLLYVVEDPANDLPDGADGVCLAGSDLFSTGATDSLVFTATSGTTYYVVVDLFADVSGNEFLLLIEEL